MFLIYPIFLYYGYTRPINRKYYTELLADNGDDGQYIRDCLSYHKPGLWKHISAQLNELGFDFKQSLVTKNGLEFPTNFVSSRTIFWSKNLINLTQFIDKLLDYLFHCPKTSNSIELTVLYFESFIWIVNVKINKMLC